VKKFYGKGQADRLIKQHELSGGQKGIFGKSAQEHDVSIRQVSSLVFSDIVEAYPKLEFRIRNTISKKEINNYLKNIDKRLGDTLYIKKSSIKPDGRIIEVKDKAEKWRVIFVGESKHQGNDIEKIEAGIMQGKNKDQLFMVAGNAIERVHKNIMEMKNFMLLEKHFPYVVFFQGSNFATESINIKTPNGKNIKLVHDSGSLNRIDRVTASSYAMPINQNNTENILIQNNHNKISLQAASLYFQCFPWEARDMYKIIYETIQSSLQILAADLNDH